MNKIAIIAPSSRSYTPYLLYYEKILNDVGIPFEVFYWDRFHLHEKNMKGKTFTCKYSDHGLGSILGYSAYRRFLLGELQDKSYASYIVLSVQIGVLLYSFLKKKKYILDIRDFSHENKSLYRFFANRVIDNAAAVAISSDGFRRWLPKGKEYLLSHNVSFESFHNVNTSPLFVPEKFVISYIGSVSYYDTNLRVINAVARDHRLFLRYIGSGTCEKRLENYCTDNKIKNVEFLGRYTPPQKTLFYEETDFVLSCYGDDTEIVRSLTPNRLYESCIMGRPIIANTGTYLATLIEDYGLGIVVNLENIDDLYGRLLVYANHDNYLQYVENCSKFIEKVQGDMDVFSLNVKSVLNNM